MGNFLERFRIDLLLSLVAISWGSTYLVAKELVTGDTVLALLSVRMLLAAGFMAVVMGFRRKRVSRAELLAGLPLGVLLGAVLTFETFGIAHTSATNAGLIISLTMLFTPVLESIVSRRRLPAAFFVAAFVAVIGVVLLSGNGAFELPSAGDLLILGAAVLRAVHVVYMHRRTVGTALDLLHLTTVQLGTCALFFTACSFLYGEPAPIFLFRLGPQQWMMLLYLVLICTVFAFFVQIWAVRGTSPSRVSLLLGTEPVWAAVIGVTIAHDRIGAAGYCGVVLVLIGTALGRSVDQRRRLKRPERPPRSPRPPETKPESYMAGYHEAEVHRPSASSSA